MQYAPGKHKLKKKQKLCVHIRNHIENDQKSHNNTTQLLSLLYMYRQILLLIIQEQTHLLVELLLPPSYQLL